MKKKILALTAGLLTALTLTACGKDPALTQFKEDFAALDFPTEFDYLESLADEASEYMTTAVESYHEAYDNGGYNQLTADYAKENYARAYKRIQIIITFLHGEQPEDVNLTTAEETAAASAAE